MSGGRWNYENDSLCGELFGDFSNHPARGEGFEVSSQMAGIGPFQDIELNEQLWDMFCLLHEYDWYKSGDTNVKAWEKARKTYKEKWFGKTPDERASRIAEAEKIRFEKMIDHAIRMEEEDEDW